MALIIKPEPIQPNEPKRRILENSLAGFDKFSIAIEFVSDIVGIKQMLYKSNTGKNSEKLVILVNKNRTSAPNMFRNASTLFAEKNRSAIIPTKTGDIIAAIAAVLYANPI